MTLELFSNVTCVYNTKMIGNNRRYKKHIKIYRTGKMQVFFPFSSVLLFLHCCSNYSLGRLINRSLAQGSRLTLIYIPWSIATIIRGSVASKAWDYAHADNYSHVQLRVLPSYCIICWKRRDCTGGQTRNLAERFTCGPRREPAIWDTSVISWSGRVTVFDDGRLPIFTCTYLRGKVKSMARWYTASAVPRSYIPVRFLLFSMHRCIHLRFNAGMRSR